MFGIGITELVVIVVLAIIILGPKDFILYCKKIAKIFYNLSRYKKDVESTLKNPKDY